VLRKSEKNAHRTADRREVEIDLMAVSGGTDWADLALR
jgi:hypothetical protein